MTITGFQSQPWSCVFSSELHAGMSRATKLGRETANSNAVTSGDTFGEKRPAVRLLADHTTPPSCDTGGVLLSNDRAAPNSQPAHCSQN